MTNALSPNRIKFQSLPEKIRSWLTSDTATEKVISINKRFNISGDRVKIIPRTITRLVIGLISAENLVSEIQKELMVSLEEATKISSEIRNDILSPIADYLKSSQKINIDILPIVKKIAATSSQKQIAPVAKTDKVGPTSPFMLHEEEPAKPLPQSQTKESFSFHVPVDIKPAAKPAPARFGSSFEDALQKQPEKQMSKGGDDPKVVHYHSYRSFPKLVEEEPAKKVNR